MTADTVLRLLLWGVVLNVGVLLLVLWRRGLEGRVGFAMLLLADLLLAVGLLVARKHDHFLAFVAVGGFIFLVLVPMVLRGVTAWAVRHGRWELALRITDVRELLQPGAGIGREKELLAFLRQVQTGETGDILEHLKLQARDTRDPEVQAVLQEQILTLYVLERRWMEAKAHADEFVTPTMVAQRPRLGAAMIRVHGELGDLEAVVQMMYLVEGGEGAQEAEAAEVLEHCRLMLLAFTGHAQELEELLGDRQAPAAEAKVHAFWLGVAWQQAGDAERARHWFDRSEKLLDATDERAREAIRTRRATLARGVEPVTVPDPEQTARLVEAIRGRAARQLAQPRQRPSLLRHTPVTLMLVLVNLVIYGFVEWFGPGADPNRRLILAGASLNTAVDAGEYWRLATAMFLHAGWFHLGLNTFMLWFLGRFAEQLLGSVRFFVIYFGAGLVGNLASHLWRSYPVSVGASSSIFGLLGATLVVLLLSRGRVPESWRRSVLFVLVLVIGLSFLPGLVDVPQIDNYAHLGGLAGGLLLGGLLLSVAGRRVGIWLNVVLGLICVGVLVYCVYGLFTSDLTQLPWARSVRSGVAVRHPVTWYVVPGDRPGQVAMVDLLDHDQVYVTRVAGESGAPAQWQQRREQTFRARLGKVKDGVRVRAVQALSAAALPKGWRGLRVEEQRKDGSLYVRVEAYGVRGPPPRSVGWHGVLFTAPPRFKAVLHVFGRILKEARAAP